MITHALGDVRPIGSPGFVVALKDVLVRVQLQWCDKWLGLYGSDQWREQHTYVGLCRLLQLVVPTSCFMEALEVFNDGKLCLC